MSRVLCSDAGGGWQCVTITQYEVSKHFMFRFVHTRREKSIRRSQSRAQTTTHTHTSTRTHTPRAMDDSNEFYRVLGNLLDERGQRLHNYELMQALHQRPSDGTLATAPPRTVTSHATPFATAAPRSSLLMAGRGMEDGWRLDLQGGRQEMVVVIQRKLRSVVPSDVGDAALRNLAMQVEKKQWMDARSKLHYTDLIKSATSASAAPVVPVSAASVSVASTATAQLGDTGYTLDEMCRFFFRDYLRDYLAIDQDVENDECVMMTARKLGVLDLSNSIDYIAIQCWNLLAVAKLLEVEESSSGETCQGDSAARDSPSASTPKRSSKLLRDMGYDLDVILGHFNLSRQDIATKDGIVQYVYQEDRYFSCKFLKRINNGYFPQLYLARFDTIESAVAARTIMGKLIMSNDVEEHNLLLQKVIASRSPPNTRIANISSIICKVISDNKEKYLNLKAYFANPPGRKRSRGARN